MRSKQLAQRSEVVALVGALLTAIFLVACLVWLLIHFEFATSPDLPQWAMPINARYLEFLRSAAIGMVIPVCAVAFTIIRCWRRLPFTCTTLGIVLLHRILEFHIVFVLINTRMKM